MKWLALIWMRCFFSIEREIKIHSGCEVRRKLFQVAYSIYMHMRVTLFLARLSWKRADLYTPLVTHWMYLPGDHFLSFLHGRSCVAWTLSALDMWNVMRLSGGNSFGHSGTHGRCYRTDGVGCLGGFGVGWNSIRWTCTHGWCYALSGGVGCGHRANSAVRERNQVCNQCTLAQNRTR